MTANKPKPMKTDPADTTIEECYWQTLGIVRSARRFAKSNCAGHGPTPYALSYAPMGVRL